VEVSRTSQLGVRQSFRLRGATAAGVLKKDEMSA